MNKELTYNEAAKRLEEIVTIIEQQSPDVDELTKYVEEAIGLVSFCRDKLTKTDKKLEQLMAKLDEGSAFDQATDD